MRLSIIIPVYNVEQYLRKCLDSVLQQDIPHEEYEVIVVNDGSPDDSVGVVKKVQEVQMVQKGFTNIKLVNRENGGLSAARNTGLEHAQGEYVWFVDSDDWIEPNCISSLLTYAEDNYLDVHCFGLQLAFEDGKKEKYTVSYEKNGYVYNGDEFICKVGMPPTAWAALYRKDFLFNNKLRFMEGILHEDQEFTPRAYYLAKRIAYTDQVVYNYLQRTGSIMKSDQSSKRCKDMLVIADSLYAFMQKYMINKTETNAVFRDKINFIFSQSLAYYRKDIIPLSEYKRKPYYPLTGKLALKYRLMNVSLTLYLFIYKFNTLYKIIFNSRYFFSNLL